ncbi:hypothetical protein MUB18_01795 [Sphingobacterium sp. PCS056]|jgi:predicted O-linked N-acetylglucosamine transferase (SPINDLY family)|uniref:hypothetical protein n=1 Tax=Sphingobacterium TaxID=28453 RepID=UPI00200FBE6B|nr:hypothetical protein [Sphingobacterium sp. PCS056]UPZ37056.1 hypothetical protein MUB18_01795 [Sphingobacterium sp. PCS056]
MNTGRLFFLLSICLLLSVSGALPSSACFVFSFQDTSVRSTKIIKQDTTILDTAQIVGEKSSAEEKMAEKLVTYRSIYFWGDTKNMVTLPHQGGLAVNLNKFYNLLSRQGRASRRLQKQFEREFEQDKVLAKWAALTQAYTALTGDSLVKFRAYYEPSSRWLRKADHYDQIAYVQHSLKNYLDSVEIIHQRLSLPKLEILNP